MSLFKKKRRHSTYSAPSRKKIKRSTIKNTARYSTYTLLPKRKKIKKRTVADEFKKHRTHSLKYLVSKTQFQASRIIRHIVALSAVFIFVGTIIIILFFSAFFSVQNIKLNRLDFRVDPENIAIMTQKYRGQKIFLISRAQIRKYLMEKNPQIASVKVKKVYPRTLVITIGNYPIAVKWKIPVRQEGLLNIEEGDEEEIILDSEDVGSIVEEESVEPEGERNNIKIQEFYVNTNGRVSHGTSEDKDAFLIEEQEIQDKFFKLNEKVILKEDLEKILASRTLLQQILKTKVLKAKYFRYAREFHLVTDNGTKYWIDFASPSNKQIEKLNHIIAEQPEILNQKIDYFDLRVKERIFYKPM